jgi:hypothetical protein
MPTSVSHQMNNIQITNTMVVPTGPLGKCRRNEFQPDEVIVERLKLAV